MEFDVVDFITFLKKKICIAMAVIIVKEARNEGVSAAQYTKTFQETYVKENQDHIDEILLQRYLNHCQEEFLQKLRKSIPVASIPCTIIEEDQDLTSYGGGSLDWFENPSPPSSITISPKENVKSQIIPEENIFSSEVSAMKHLKFIESLMRLKDESERKSPISTNILSSLLYDEMEHHKNSATDEKFSEDSGIGSSEQFSENNSVNYVSSDVVKFALQTSNTQQVLINSMKLVLNHVKRELSTNTEEAFLSWKGSLAEYTFKILRDCSLSNVECKDMLLNLIFHFLEKIWTDRSLSQHIQWEMKIYIVNTLYTDQEDCYEVLQYISERLDYAIRLLCRKSNDVPLIMEKLYHLLNLYSKVCQKFMKLKLYIDHDKSRSEEDKGDVTMLWQERWCQKESDSGSKNIFLSAIEEDQIQVLERLIILISERYPIIASLAKECLKYAHELILKESSEISG